MGFTLQNIRYGWTALLGILLTGTTIYVSNNTRHHVQQIDIIPIALGTYERCLATQTATNPTYSVSPPSFTRTWYTNNPYSVVTNTVTNWYMARYTNVVTNTIGFYIDKPMMDDLDDTIKQLVSCYGWSNSPGENMTVTGLWASLGIGDGTNKFTSVPCWTNDARVVYPINFTNYYPHTNAPTTNSFTSLYPETVRYAYGFWSNGYYWTNRLFSASNVITTTNLATYGNYTQQIYVVALQERYKVLNAMRYMIDNNKSITSNRGFYSISYGDPIQRFTVSNTVTHLIDYGYDTIVSMGQEMEKAYIAYCGFSPYVTNFYGGDWTAIGQTGVSERTWGEISGWASIYWSSWYVNTNKAPATFQFYYQSHKYVPDYTEYYGNRYEWRSSMYKSAVILKWANYQQTNISSLFSVYYIGATNAYDGYPNEIVTNGYWTKPQTWDLEYLCPLEENLTASSLYQKIDDSFIDTEGIYNVLNLGWDEFDLPGDVPPPAVCAEPSGGVSHTDNTGSVGKSLGMGIPFANFKGVRDFQFSYCTERFW
jgi:hypothetical protein